MRGELWEALNGVSFIRGGALLPLLAWRDGFDNEDYRRLEDKTDPRSLSCLTDTAALPEVRSLYAALRASVDSYRDLRAVVFGRCGIVRDPAPERALLGRMEELWSTGGYGD